MEKLRIRKWLFDIKLATASIEKFMAGRRFDELDEDADEIVKRAVEREIEIIGEAINRILIVEPDIKITFARQYVNVRNVVIHRYDEIEDKIIAPMLTNYLPTLKTEIEKLLAGDYFDDDFAG